MCGCRDGERKSAERQKRDTNNVAFYAVSSSSPYGYLWQQLKTQKSKHRSHQFRTQMDGWMFELFIDAQPQ